MRHRTPPKPPDHRSPAAWQRAAAHLERHCPDFPLAYEVAYRLADHHAAALPIGWEGVPVVMGEPTPYFAPSHTATEGG